jgi:hypothetical protein
MTATQLFGVGLIAELLQTTQLRETGKYAIRNVVGFGAPVVRSSSEPVGSFAAQHQTVDVLEGRE